MADTAAAIVIPVLDEADNIAALLDDCARQEPAAAEVIVVDAGSTDGTAEVLAERARRWPALTVLTVVGAPPGAARNAGIRAATTPLIATVDGGSRIGSGWLGALVARLLEKPESRAVVGRSAPDPHSDFERAAGWFTVRAFKPPDRPGLIGRTFLPAGRNGYCFTRQAWEASGGYPDDLPWGEDKVFLERLREVGLEVVVASDAVVRWRPRASLRALCRQYSNYGRADAMARIDRQNELVPLAFYAAALVLAARSASGRRAGAFLLAVGAVGYLGAFVTAAAREVRSLRAIVWVPVIRVAVDMAKMQGFLAWTLKADSRNAGLRSLLRLGGSATAFTVAHLLRLTRRRAGVAVVYHRVGDPPGDPARELVPRLGTRLFRSQVRHLRSCYRLVTASELPEATARRGPGQRIPAAITFDDDLASHARVTAPILEELGVPATFFLTGATLRGPSPSWWERLQTAVDRGVVDERLLSEVSAERPRVVPGGGSSGGIHRLAQSIQLMEPSRRAALERRLSEVVGEPDEGAGLRAADVGRLARGGFEIGFHTLRHHYLPALSDGDLVRAMREGRAELAEAAGAEPDAIAYPHGGAGAREAAAAHAAGFRVGYTGTAEAVRPASDRLLLGRVEGSFCSTGQLAVRVAARLAGLR